LLILRTGPVRQLAREGEAMHHETLSYQADGLTMRSRLVFEDSSGQRAGVLVFPEAFGLDKRTIERAEQLAALGYVVLACDLHGEGHVVDDLQDAMAQVQPLLDDPTRARARAAGALQALAARPEVDPARIAAISFRFPMSLELARAGTEIKAAVGLHTSLTTNAPMVDPNVIRAHMLICMGGDDPSIPPSHWSGFAAEMHLANAEWQMNLYGSSVQDFGGADPATGDQPDTIFCNPQTDALAWASALDLFERVLA
jgi:dienelactone hydrolase